MSRAIEENERLEHLQAPLANLSPTGSLSEEMFDVQGFIR